jgi:hypothetical protein
MPVSGGGQNRNILRYEWGRATAWGVYGPVNGEGGREIRNNEFSDLRSRRKILLPEGHKKRWIVAMRGLLPEEQNS